MSTPIRSFPLTCPLRAIAAALLISVGIGCTSDSPTGGNDRASDSALRDYIQTPKEKAGAVSDAADERNAEIEDAVQELEE